MAKINKNKCVGCGICANICPEGIEMVDGKAEIKNENAGCLKDAARACPQNAISIGDEEESSEGDRNPNFNQNYGQGRGIGMGLGKKMGRGMRHMGRGMGQRRQ